MFLNENDISLLMKHIQDYGAHRFFQGRATTIPNIEMMSNEKKKALYHYNKICEILKQE